jgi:hypothetical protein
MIVSGSELRCSCGNVVLVRWTQAGESVVCSCGTALEVPSLRELARDSTTAVVIDDAIVPHRRFQYSIRALLALMLVVACIAALVRTPGVVVLVGLVYFAGQLLLWVVLVTPAVYAIRSVRRAMADYFDAHHMRSPAYRDGRVEVDS